MKRAVLVVLIIAVAAVGAWWTQKPRSRTLETPDITGWGIIQVRQDVVISAEIGGRVATVEADEGDVVGVGLPLVQLDEDLVLSQIAQAHAAIDGAEANLAKAKAGASSAAIEVGQSAVDAARSNAGAAWSAVDTAKASLRASEAVYRGAQVALAKLATGPSERELELAGLEADLADSHLWEAQARRDTTKSGVDLPLSVPIVIGDFDLGSLVLVNPAAPRQWDVDLAEASISEAESGLMMAELEYERLKAGSRAEELAIMEAQVEKARAGRDVAQVRVEKAERAARVAEAQVRQSQAQLEIVMAGAGPGVIAAAEAQVLRAKAEADILEVRREKLSLRAPMAGVVTQRTVSQGETVVPGARLFTISVLDPALLTIYILQEALGRTSVRQVAAVRVDGYPDRVFTGEVVHVASRGEFTPRSVQIQEQRATTVFAVRIEIPNENHMLKPGMSATATLH